VAAASTTVETTAAAESAARAAAAEAASAAAIAARYAATRIPTGHAAAGITARAARIAMARISAAAIAATITVATAIAVVASIPAMAPAMTPTPSVPGSDADEDAADEIVWTVIAVWGAGIGVIGVIAPRAIRGTIIAVISGIDHSGTNAHPRRDLGIRRDSGERQSYKHCQHNQAEFPHDILLVPPDH
jgi:hypothetical protein